MREVKQVIVMRKDLNMRKGKMVAQGAHASMKVLLNLMSDKHYLSEMEDGGAYGYIEKILDVETDTPLHEWLMGSFTKICLGVNSLSELGIIYKTARDKFIPCAMIKDSGRTEFGNQSTITCCAIGPWWSDEIDEITGKLPLL